MMITMFRLKYLIFTLIVLACFGQSNSQTNKSTLILKNGKKISGDIVEDTQKYILLLNDLGEIKIKRNDIEEIHYKGFITPTSDSLLSEKTILDDHVVVHLRNGEVVDGYLYSKSPTMIMLQSELGRLTLPKKDVKMIEYVSKEFAERGEPIAVYLVNGAQLNGYMYHEDRSSITLSTKMGRLTIDKNQLRRIEYHTDVDFDKPGKEEETYLTLGKPVQLERGRLDKRMDSFEINYSSHFGDNYGGGSSFIYKNRHLLKRFNTFSIYVEGNLAFTGFTLNKTVITKDEIPGSVSANGAAIITTLGGGIPFHLFPAQGSAYRFFITPQLETHLVHKSLKKTYPSFPSLSYEERSTDFRFGFGNQIGLEWSLFNNWRAGVSFNMHFILGESDYNSIAIYIGTRLY